MRLGPRLVVLAGPTAVGKTGLAIELCRRLGAEIVNADSVQVFRGLDIGSAKPTPAEQAAARHHLVDVAGPEEDFDAARFAALADEAIADIAARGRRVLVSGGTGLYIRALLWGLVPAPPPDLDLRARLQAEWEQEGGAALHARLSERDPEAAARIHPADRQRVLRALEVCLQTGRPFSRIQAEHRRRTPRYPHLYLGLERPREELNRRIELRSRQMLEGGLVEEVAGLLARGVDPRAKPMQSLGYRQAVELLAGERDLDATQREIVRQTKAYAKRQLTWFRGVTGIEWHPPDRVEEVARRAADFWSGTLPAPAGPDGSEA